MRDDIIALLSGLVAIGFAVGTEPTELDVVVAHPLLGRGSVHASTITGGAELSSHPARCALGLERRTLPGESQADIEAELDALRSG